MEDISIKNQDNGMLNVLIADDDGPTRMLLRAAVKQWKYDVIEAHDGEEVWEIMQLPDAPRLLILDWMMPKLSGLEVAQRIRQKSSFHPYIILLTQASGTENVIKGLEAGADEFLSKPFNMAELKSRLSVGAKLIKNEKIMTEERLFFQTYVKNLSIIVSQVLTISQHLDSFLKTQESKEPSDQIQKIQELNNALKDKMSEIKNMQSEPEIKGSL